MNKKRRVFIRLLLTISMMATVSTALAVDFVDDFKRIPGSSATANKLNNLIRDWRVYVLAKIGPDVEWGIDNNLCIVTEESFGCAAMTGMTSDALHTIEGAEYKGILTSAVHIAPLIEYNGILYSVNERGYYPFSAWSADRFGYSPDGVVLTLGDLVGYKLSPFGNVLDPIHSAQYVIDKIKQQADEGFLYSRIRQVERQKLAVLANRMMNYRRRLINSTITEGEYNKIVKRNVGMLTRLTAAETNAVYNGEVSSDPALKELADKGLSPSCE